MSDKLGERTSHFGIAKVEVFCAHREGYDLLIAKRKGDRYRLDYPDGEELEMARKQFTIKVNKDNIRKIVYHTFIHGQPTHSKCVQSDWMDYRTFFAELSRIVGQGLATEAINVLGESTSSNIKVNLNKGQLLSLLKSKVSV